MAFGEQAFWKAMLAGMVVAFGVLLVRQHPPTDSPDRRALDALKVREAALVHEYREPLAAHAAMLADWTAAGEVGHPPAVPHVPAADLSELRAIRCRIVSLEGRCQR